MRSREENKHKHINQDMDIDTTLGPAATIFNLAKRYRPLIWRRSFVMRVMSGAAGGLSAPETAR